MKRIICKTFGHRFKLDPENNARKQCKRNCGAVQFLMLTEYTYSNPEWETYWIADIKIK